RQDDVVEVLERALYLVVVVVLDRRGDRQVDRAALLDLLRRLRVDVVHAELLELGALAGAAAASAGREHQGSGRDWCDEQSPPTSSCRHVDSSLGCRPAPREPCWTAPFDGPECLLDPRRFACQLHDLPWPRPVAGHLVVGAVRVARRLLLDTAS